jgi:protein involved in polysaccharide export with SLBB domain
MKTPLCVSPGGRRRRGASRTLAAALALLIASPLPAWGQVGPAWGQVGGTGQAGAPADAQRITPPGAIPQGPMPQGPIPQGPKPPTTAGEPLRFLREASSFPTITVVEPRNGAVVTRDDHPISIAFSDARNELDLQTLRIFVNGVDRTAGFDVTPAGAKLRAGAGVSAEPLLREGANSVVASIKNLAGNTGAASAGFVLDTTTVLLTRPGTPSPLEEAFAAAPSQPSPELPSRAIPPPAPVSRQLTQFGYDAFRTLLPSVGPAPNLPVDPSYTLGPGDSLALYVWNVPGSAVFDSVPLVLDRTGTVFVPRMGAVLLQGLTLAQARDVLRAQIARYYSGFEMQLTLGELRTISVYVMGEVARPGSYNISPFSTVLDALFAGGGPTKMGTLRAVRVTRNGQVAAEVDLYELLLRGSRPTGPGLQTGDTVFVPPIGPVAGVAGEVKRPGIYELRPGTTVAALIAMAGGPLPTAGLARIQVERQQALQGRILLDLPFIAEQGGGGQELLQDGDLVSIFPAPNRLENGITLEGFVRTPGLYEWKPGMRVSDLLTPDSLLPEAYRDRVEIARVRPDFSREILTVNLKLLWGPAADRGQDLMLQPLDKLSVQSEVLALSTVTLAGEVKRPGTYVITKGERLSSVLRRAGGFTPEAFPKGGVFTRASLRQREREQLEKFVRAQSQTITAEAAATAAASADISGQAAYVAAQPVIVRQQTDLLRSLASAVTLGRLAIRLDAPDLLEGTADDILLETGDALHVPPQPTSVLILGAVRNSTSVLWRVKQNADQYIAQAGGATREADLDQTYILKADGSAVASFVKLRQVEPGDAIVVPISTEPRIRTLPLIKDIAAILGGFALPAAAIYGILKD